MIPVGPLIDIMSKFVTSPPFRMQIAFQGNWMDAWRFSQGVLPSSEAVEEALAGRGADVAVEFCFRLATGENFFFGQRRLGQQDDERTVSFVNQALACGCDRDWIDLPDFLSRLEQVTSNVERSGQIVLCGDPDNIEVGITDWWGRGDVVEVWNRQSVSVPNGDQLAQQLKNSSSLHKNNINFVCLEFNFRSPMHHWCGIEVSEYRDGHHILKIANVLLWLTRCFPRADKPVD
jgi:hypothetical protein